MKRQSFFKGVIVAAVLALVGSIAFYGLSYAAGSERAFHIVAIILGGAYIAYLLRGSSERTGRIVVFSVWVAITSGVWFLTTDLTLALLTQAVLISLVRTLYHHARVLAALLDFLLSTFALSAAVWASAQSHSLFLSVWCFFLVQALFVWIPASFNAGEQRAFAENSTRENEFGRAFRTAETAIKRIAAPKSSVRGL